MGHKPNLYNVNIGVERIGVARFRLFLGSPFHRIIGIGFSISAGQSFGHELG